MTKADPFLHALYDSLGDSPMQQKLRKLRPFPVGAVFIRYPEWSDEDCRQQFKQMKELGFTCLKQCFPEDGTEASSGPLRTIAFEEGLNPWFFDDAGFEDPSPKLFQQLGIPQSISSQELRKNPIWIEHNRRRYQEKINSRPVDVTSVASSHDDQALPGTVKKSEYGLPPEMAARFTIWLKEKYQTVDALWTAWNCDLPLQNVPKKWQDWAEVESQVIQLVNSSRGEYRRMMDCARYKADLFLGVIAKKMQGLQDAEPGIPRRAGGEMSLFLPMATWCTDFEGIGRVVKDFGALYASIHPTWHFEESNFEVVRPVMTQASLLVDYAKGAWAAPFEAVGGPQVNSGGSAHLYPWAADQVPGFTCDAGVMTQIMLTWVAAGVRGFGQWCWNTRRFGWEAGESSLTDRNGRIGERARAAGAIGKACQKYRDEIWQTHKEPVVGIFTSFQADTLWGAMSIGLRPMFKWIPTYARIGASRICIDANIPFEFVTDTNLFAGLVDRYKVIYLPTIASLDTKLLPILSAWVERGGRLVIDTPTGWYDGFGRLLRTEAGTAFEKLFGAELSEIHYGQETDRPWYKDQNLLTGYQAILTPTTAKVVERFDDGRPLVTEHALGKGSAVIIATQVSLACQKPGNHFIQKFAAKHLLGATPLPFTCDGCLAYRLSAPDADHYFLINDGAPTSVHLTSQTIASVGQDAVSGETVHTNSITLPGWSGRWLRFPRV